MRASLKPHGGSTDSGCCTTSKSWTQSNSGSLKTSLVRNTALFFCGCFGIWVMVALVSLLVPLCPQHSENNLSFRNRNQAETAIRPQPSAKEEPHYGICALKGGCCCIKVLTKNGAHTHVCKCMRTNRRMAHHLHAYSVGCDHRLYDDTQQAQAPRGVANQKQDSMSIKVNAWHRNARWSL